MLVVGDKKENIFPVIVVLILTISMTILMTSIFWEGKTAEKNEEIENLEHLVNYHQQQTFNLIQELHDIKNPGE